MENDTLTVEQLMMRLRAFPQGAKVVFRTTPDEGRVVLPITHVFKPADGEVVIE